MYRERNLINEVVKSTTRTMNNYCPTESPFITYRKEIQYAAVGLIVIILVLYIAMPGVSEATDALAKQVTRVKPKSNAIKSVMVILFMIAFVVVVAAYLFYRTVIYNRQNRCLAVYSQPQYLQIQIPKTPLTTYQNPYFNKEMTYLVRDFYYLAASQASLPCGQYNDLSSSRAIEEVLRRGARWLEFNLYWTPRNNYDTNPTAYISTGSGQEPTNLIFAEEEPLTLLEGLKTVAREGWRQTDMPLFIVLQAEKLLENGMFPSLFVEKHIANCWASAFYNRIPSPNYMNFQTPLAEIPMPDTVGKVFLVVNWKPQEERLKQVTTDRIESPEEKFPQAGIQTIELVPDDLPYGGIKAKFVSPTEMIEHNKFKMTRMTYKTEPSVNNMTSPKMDLENTLPFDAFDMGLQVVPMHFTVFPGKDDSLLKTLEFFKDSPIKLKPEELRYIPKPAPPIKKQYQELSYAPREYKDSRPGFAQLDI